MNTESQKNKKHWNNLNSNYSKAWRSKAREKLSEQELRFISSAIDQKQQKYLDVGVGVGRIINCLAMHTGKNAAIYGVDISEEMIKITRDKFKGNKKIKEFKVADISQEKVPFKNTFDMITAIRVLKYSKDWKTSIKNLSNALSPNGKLVFTMTNKHSVNILGKTEIKFYRTTVKELKDVLHKQNLKIVRIEGFSRLPDVLYFLTNNIVYTTMLISIEKLSDKIFGKIMLQREFFIEVRKVGNSQQ